MRNGITSLVASLAILKVEQLARCIIQNDFSYAISDHLHYLDWY